MSNADRPIIAGAGPVGLGAALFLALDGRRTRIVEMRAEPSHESRALAINPRTLEILEPTGVTSKLLELGLPIHGAQIHRGARVVAEFTFGKSHPKYPFMLGLSQASTERLLAEALATAGCVVERGIRMVGCRNANGGVEVTLEPTRGGAREVATGPWLLAADGAHSVARQQLGIGFPGTSSASEWYLADVPLRTQLTADRAHVFFLDGGGFLFLLRVINDKRKEDPGGPLWRVITTRPEPLSWLQQAEATGPPIWASAFHISHRINTTLASGQVYFAGDAAHIHSPIGARGMNLGLEDACVFARLERAGKLAEYDALRHPVDEKVVRRVEFFSRVVSGESRYYRFLRSMMPTAVSISFVRNRLMAILTGLDHSLPVEVAHPLPASPSPSVQW
jgi:2-polyprenyl-6-methoxyphenol hydroxylase-like FAD-dependent oxidoreductase